jgi:hypothetical protein
VILDRHRRRSALSEAQYRRDVESADRHLEIVEQTKTAATIVYAAVSLWGSTAFWLWVFDALLHTSLPLPLWWSLLLGTWAGLLWLRIVALRRFRAWRARTAT